MNRSRAARWVVVLALALAGCKKSPPPGPIPEGMPEGTTVTLTEREKDPPAMDSMKGWYGWQLKGLALKKEGKNQEALYCFRQALSAWPPVIPDEVKADPRRSTLYKSVPTDTQLQLAAIFVDLADKKWALHFLDAYDQELPGNSASPELRKKALALP